MSTTPLPLLIEPDELQARLGEEGLLVVDLSRSQTHQELHIPGAVFLDYGQIVAARPPVGGLLPPAAQLEQVLGAIGLTPDTRVVAYDDEGGGKAARLLWTLASIGHPGETALLNGGLHAWANEGHPLSREPTRPQAATYRVSPERTEALIDTDELLTHLDDPAYGLLDARSPEEFTGQRLHAARGGHIPGACNIEWTRFMDPNHNLRLLPEARLRALLEEAGLAGHNTIVAYCQTHHRSAHTWLVLRYLGYHARGYAGSWSEWGNRPDTPVEV